MKTVDGLTPPAPALFPLKDSCTHSGCNAGVKWAKSASGPNIDLSEGLLMQRYRGRSHFEAGEDALGFAELSRRLAQSLIHDQKFNDGIVLGIEGRWGSGKTSLLALTRKELAKEATNTPVIVDFRPWLIGDREALIQSFFTELSKAIARENTKDSKKLTSTVLDYTRRVAGAGAVVADLAEVAGIPYADRVNRVRKWFYHLYKGQRLLPEIKDALDKNLKKLGKKIVVTIDDVDRLEPREISEILRLVRSVADFGSIIYILCYDSEIMAEAVSKSLEVSEGRAFMEKIVQITIPVPRPEPFALRNMLRYGVDQIATASDEAGTARLERVIGEAGGLLLSTPRDVNRVLDSIDYFWPALQGKVDLADFVWLQIIRYKSPKLYQWIEKYCTELAAVANGNAFVTENEKERMTEDLKHALKESEAQHKEFGISLLRHLPGLSSLYWATSSEEAEDPNRGAIFGRESSKMKLAALQDKRLGSPDHFRYYFALKEPTGSVTESDFRLLFEAADVGCEQVETILRRWFSERGVDNGTKAAAAIGRLSGAAPSALNAGRSRLILRVLAEVMDLGAPERGLAMWERRTWNEAQGLLRLLRYRIGSEFDTNEAIQATKVAFREGSAIGWLVHLLRAETFAHGRHGDQRTPESEWLFGEKEFDDIALIMRERFENIPFENIFDTPQPISLFYAWKQIGDNGCIRSKFSLAAKENCKFIAFLGYMTTDVSSSEGQYQAIRRQDIDLFVDAVEAEQRLNEICNGGGQIGDAANQLLRKLNIDDDL